MCFQGLGQSVILLFKFFSFLNKSSLSENFDMTFSQKAWQATDDRLYYNRSCVTDFMKELLKIPPKLSFPQQLSLVSNSIWGKTNLRVAMYESKSNPGPGTGPYAGLTKRLCKAHLDN